MTQTHHYEIYYKLKLIPCDLSPISIEIMDVYKKLHPNLDTHTYLHDLIDYLYLAQEYRCLNIDDYGDTVATEIDKMIKFDFLLDVYCRTCQGDFYPDFVNELYFKYEEGNLAQHEWHDELYQ